VSNSADAIRRVIEAFERSEWSEIDVRSGGLRVHLSISTPTGPLAPAPPVTIDEPGRRPEPVPLVADSGSSPVIAESPPSGAHVVLSPSFGVFWRAPEPGVPPFVDLGHDVETSATVCIVEVMKLMYQVKATVAGIVVGVYAENGAAVQKDQALFAIAPPGRT
jgi:biotin carboxyl carrier protein